MSALGVLPNEAVCLTIPEMKAYMTHRNLRIAEVVITLSWRTINFLGGFFSGKLRNLKEYMPDTPERVEERYEFEEDLKEDIKTLANRRKG